MYETACAGAIVLYWLPSVARSHLSRFRLERSTVLPVESLRCLPNSGSRALHFAAFDDDVFQVFFVDVYRLRTCHRLLQIWP